MANLKAVDADKLDALIADIADATREKTGKTYLIPDEEIPNEIRSIETGGGDDLYRQMIDGSISGEVIFPEGITTIRNGAFYYCGLITKIVVPDSVTSIGDDAFSYCSKLEELILGKGITTVPYQMARHTSALKELVVPHGVTTLKDYCFNNMALYNLWLPNTITKIGATSFNTCKSLRNLTLESGFNCAFNVSVATLLTVESLIGMFEALADLTGQTAKTLTIGATNIAKLTEEQIAIATEKNWTIA